MASLIIRQLNAKISQAMKEDDVKRIDHLLRKRSRYHVKINLCKRVKLIENLAKRGKVNSAIYFINHTFPDSGSVFTKEYAINVAIEGAIEGNQKGVMKQLLPLLKDTDNPAFFLTIIFLFSKASKYNPSLLSTLYNFFKNLLLVQYLDADFYKEYLEGELRRLKLWDRFVEDFHILPRDDLYNLQFLSSSQNENSSNDRKVKRRKTK